MIQNKTAIVLGATGLVGRSLVELLLKDETFTQIKLIVRRRSGFEHAKIEEYIVDFEDINSYKDKVIGDVLFSCMGTTIKQAGSKKAQYKVDYTYQYEVAQAAYANKVSSYILVSSSGANAKSKMFYPRMKGELDEAVTKLGFKSCLIFRPSLLLGERNEKRTGEAIGGLVIKVLVKIIPSLKKHRGIKGEEVAQAMINAYEKNSNKGTTIYTLDELFELI